MKSSKPMHMNGLLSNNQNGWYIFPHFQLKQIPIALINGLTEIFKSSCHLIAIVTKSKNPEISACKQRYWAWKYTKFFHFVCLFKQEWIFSLLNKMKNEIKRHLIFPIPFKPPEDCIHREQFHRLKRTSQYPYWRSSKCWQPIWIFGEIWYGTFVKV